MRIYCTDIATRLLHYATCSFEKKTGRKGKGKGRTLCLVIDCHWAIRYILKMCLTPFMQWWSPSHVSKANRRVISKAFPSILSIPCIWLAGSFCREAFALVSLPVIALLFPGCTLQSRNFRPLSLVLCGSCKYANPRCTIRLVLFISCTDENMLDSNLKMHHKGTEEGQMKIKFMLLAKACRPAHRM